MTSPIKKLFATDVTRPIEEVIKVDQTDEEIIRFEIDEYVVTDAIAGYYEDILDSYAATPNKPHEGIAVWVSGFFGSGKSSFAKMLGLALDNREIAGTPAGQRFGARTNDKIAHLVNNVIAKNIPTHSVIFDVSTDRGIKTGNQTLTEIMYRLFLVSLGYAKDLDLAELEIGLEGDGRLEQFEAAFEKVTGGKKWDDRKGLVSFALSEASAAMHEIDPGIYADKGQWAATHSGKADITPGLLGQRINELIARRKPGHTVVFVVDEVGQFVARDVQKMLDLQAIVQQLGVHGQGRQWIIVTSQEKLGEMVGGLDDKRIELARLMDRFKHQVHLEPSDISEVTSKRVLSKNADAQIELGKLFDEHRGQLTSHTTLTANINLPELSRQGFVDLYPLMPYQVDLIIQVVSGLRTQGGASKHVGGANRTIIKLAQQLLIHPDVALGEQGIGQLARLDQIYDLVESNIAGEVRAKISQIPQQVDHPQAESVAKAICLLQFVRSIHRTGENIAASLYPALAAPSQLELAKEALSELEAAQLVRQGEDGYRIPTPAEDDWAKQRDGASPKPADTKRLHREIVNGLWSPVPTHSLQDVKQFKAGLMIDGREEQKGDLAFHLTFAEEGDEFAETAKEMRTRSQGDDETIFWVVPLTKAIDRETVELHRSKEMLSRKARDARTADETALISEERGHEKRHTAELQRLLRAAVLDGTVYFRGNDRSPGDTATDVSRAASTILGQVLPVVFVRFDEGAAKSADAKRGFEELLKAADLHGLPSVFTSLNLLRSQDGSTVFDTDSSAMREIYTEIDHASGYGQKATGKSLGEKFGRDPYGWDFEVVRLITTSLLRSGRIRMRHGAEDIDDATTVAAKNALSNNNSFRSASFSPKKGVEFEDVAKAAASFEDTFGTAVREISQTAVTSDLRTAVTERIDDLEAAKTLLEVGRLPGADVLAAAIEPMKAIQRGTEESAIAEFNASCEIIKDGLRRAGELNKALTPGVLEELEAAQGALRGMWPFLKSEPDLEDEFTVTAETLDDLLQRETFFREITEIEGCRVVLRDEYDRRFEEALTGKVTAYRLALDQLIATPAWVDLSDDVRETLSAPLHVHAKDDGSTNPPIPQLRSDLDACAGRLRDAIMAAHKVVEGDRIVELDVQPFFRGGIEDTEQLEAALDGLREACQRLIADDKKIIIG